MLVSGREDLALGPGGCAIVANGHEMMTRVTQEGTATSLTVQGGSVTVTGTSPARILSVLGIDGFAIEESETAQGITGEESP